MDDASPSLVALAPGFTATAPTAPTSSRAPVPVSTSAGSGNQAPEATVQTTSTTDRPIWLDGVPVRGDLDDKDDSPQFIGKRHSNDCDLVQSLRALEQFTSSQSRRFFIAQERNGFNEALAQAQLMTSSSLEAHQPSAAQNSMPTSNQVDAGLRTAEFGTSLPHEATNSRQQPAPIVAMTFEGMDI